MVMVTPTQLSQDTRRPRPVGVAYPSQGHSKRMRRVRVVARSIIQGVQGRDRTTHWASARRGSLASR
jgi:hypothetical protein